MHKLKSFLKTKPLLLLLLPVFFFLHTLNENFTPVLFSTCLILIGIFSLLSVILYGLFFLAFKNSNKAALMTFFLLSLNLFFGSTYDFLTNNIGRAFFLKYSFILPVLLIVTILMFLFLKKTSLKFHRSVYYINTVLCIFLLFEIIVIFIRVPTGKPLTIEKTTNQLIVCDSCDKPDIYLLVADEYAGKQELKDIFSFDNHQFESDLKARGFHITNNSSSNYNATVYSMASLLNMGYLSEIKKNTQSHATILESQMLLKKNTTAPFFIKMGYDFYNHSIFEISEKSNLVSDPFYASPFQIFLSQTLLFKAYSDLSFNFASKKKVEKITRHKFYNDIKVEESTLESTKFKSPKFVYSHFGIPHPPYIFDSTGRKLGTDSLRWDLKFNKELYLSYLKYANKYYLNIIDSIFKASIKPPIIILISDHGFRQFNEPVDEKYHFMNLNAVYFPNKNYAGFYDGMSNVNLFRIILNSQFGQHLPMLKDSTISLIEPELNL